LGLGEALEDFAPNKSEGWCRATQAFVDRLAIVRAVPGDRLSILAEIPSG
jgi:hypothetical protein